MQAPARIDFVSRKWPPAMGGMETYSAELSKALASRVETRLIVCPGNPDGSVPGAAALLAFGFDAARRILLARAPGEVMHVTDMASWPLAALGRLRRPGGRRILSAHGTDVTFPRRGGLKGRLYAAYLRLGAWLAAPAAVIANSEATAREARKYGYRAVSVIPLAADVGDVAASPGAAPRNILFAGRLIPLKGARWFIENVLPDLPGDVTLDVAGTAWDADERAALDHPRVRYLGRLDQTALWRAEAEAMCVVLPNIPVPNGQFEGFGLVAVEAAAAGGIVLAARHGGLAEAVVEGETGFLLPPADAAAWVGKITEVHGWSDEARRAFATRARDHARRHFTWERVARDTFALYQGAAR